MTACSIEGDLSALQSIAPKLIGLNNVVYQEIHYDIVLWFGGPELKAQLRWKENVSPFIYPAMTICYAHISTGRSEMASRSFDSIKEIRSNNMQCMTSSFQGPGINNLRR